MTGKWLSDMTGYDWEMIGRWMVKLKTFQDLRLINWLNIIGIRAKCEWRTEWDRDSLE